MTIVFYRFNELLENSPEIATGHPKLPEWQARKSLQETLKAQKSEGRSSSVGQMGEQTSIVVKQPILQSASQPTETGMKAPPSPLSQVSATVPGDQR